MIRSFYSRTIDIGRRILERRETSLIIAIGVTLLVVGLVDPGFFQPQNLKDILIRCSATSIVACGVMLVLVTGEIDISVGSLMGLLAAVLGVLLSSDQLAIATWIGVPAVLLLGSLIGLSTGLLVTVGRIPSIIVTLGLLSAMRGMTILVMGGQNIDGLPDGLANAAKTGWMAVPISIWAAALVVAATSYIVSYQPLGRRLFALGSNQEAARVLGLSETRLKLFAFTYTGFLTAVAVIVDVPRLPKIESGIGTGFELLVVTCVVVGGVSISGGRGTVGGVLLAVFLMTIIRPVLTFLDVGDAGEKWARAVQGTFIILAVVADHLMTRGRFIRSSVGKESKR